MPAAPLTGPELLELRDAYLMDRVDEASNPKVYLSHYNAARRAQLWSDTTIQSMALAVENDKGEELAAVWAAKRLEREKFGDDPAEAIAVADAVRKEAKFRLVRARCRRMTMRDPGFSGSIADGRTRVALLESWKDEITEDENFARTRQGGLAAIPLYRR